MKIYVLCLCVLQFALAYGQVELLPLPADGTCIPNRAYKVDCNTCICTPEGKLGACTLAGCLAKQPEEPLLVEPLADCKLGTTKQEDCSKCICIAISNDKNEWTCKKLDKCELSEHKKTKRAVQECRTGDSKYNDCNPCTCVQDASGNTLWACARAFCLPRNRRAVQECRTGDTKYNDCNPCTCVEDESGNTLWACARAFCLPRNRRDVNVQSDLKDTPCAPNDFFQLPNCITCYCNSAKTGYLCSENVCSNDNNQSTATVDRRNTDNNINMEIRGRSLGDVSEKQNETEVTVDDSVTKIPINETIQE